jgi:hypothetical protein
MSNGLSRKSRRGKNKNLTALKSNSNTVRFNFQTYIYIYIYKGHSKEPESVLFMSSCPLFTGLDYMHYSLKGKIRLFFIDRDLLYRGAL